MDNIAIHMRVCAVNVSDDEVNTRSAAAVSLASNWGKVNEVSKILSKVADVAEALGGDGSPSPALGNEIQAAIQKKSSSYLYEERPLDVSVCAGMAMVSMLKGKPKANGWLITEVYAAALWSTLSYQPALGAERREKLRREVLDVTAEWSAMSAETARARVEVPDSGDLKITIGDAGVTTNNFKESMASTIEALRRNAALDREELDFLWWVQLGRSRLLNRQLTAIAEPIRIVAAGIEGARMLRRFPCEVHREIVLRTLDEDPELDLTELLAAAGDDRAVLGKEFIGGSVAAHPTVFPLLHALATGEVDGSGGALKRRVSEWGARALLEAGFIQMISQGLAKV